MKDKIVTFRNWNTYPNSINAHRAIKFYEDNGIDITEALILRFFHGQYELGENVSEISTIIDICYEVI